MILLRLSPLHATEMPVITMLSDFGLRDPYVSQMKGIILDLCPDSTIVDISHMVERHNVVEGAFLLETAVPFFPKKSIHLAVVDPGVGTGRLPIVIKSRNAILVGPDNGLLERAARKLGVIAIHKIDTNRLRLGPVSSTFHGRDVFAKIAGKLASGFPAEDVGPSLKKLVKHEIGKARLEGGKLECRILFIDTFGNLITSARNFVLDKLTSQKHWQVLARSSSTTRQAQIAQTYSDVRAGKLVVLKGSQGYVEIAAREMDASKKLRVRTGDRLEIILAG